MVVAARIAHGKGVLGRRVAQAYGNIAVSSQVKGLDFAALVISLGHGDGTTLGNAADSQFHLTAALQRGLVGGDADSGLGLGDGEVNADRHRSLSLADCQLGSICSCRDRCVVCIFALTLLCIGDVFPAGPCAGCLHDSRFGLAVINPCFRSLQRGTAASLTRCLCDRCGLFIGFVAVFLPLVFIGVNILPTTYRDSFPFVESISCSQRSGRCCGIVGNRILRSQGIVGVCGVAGAGAVGTPLNIALGAFCLIFAAHIVEDLFQSTLASVVQRRVSIRFVFVSVIPYLSDVYRAMDVNNFQAGTVTESAAANVVNAGTVDNVFQACTATKSASTDRGQTVRENKRGKSGAPKESLVSDLFQPFWEFDPGECGTSYKGLSPDRFQACRKFNTGECGTVHKCLLPDRCEPIRQGHVTQLRAAEHCLFGERLYSAAKGYFFQCFYIGKYAVRKCFRVAYDLFNRAAVKGPRRQSGHSGGDHQFRRITAHKRTGGNRRYRAGNGVRVPRRRAAGIGDQFCFISIQQNAVINRIIWVFVEIEMLNGACF